MGQEQNSRRLAFVGFSVFIHLSFKHSSPDFLRCGPNITDFAAKSCRSSVSLTECTKHILVAKYTLYFLFTQE